MPKDRSNSRMLGTDARVVYARSSSFPIEYAITLQVIHQGTWHTIYLFDNAHDFEEHHAHAYVGDRKQAPVIIEGETNTVMAYALKTFASSWSEIRDAWEAGK